MASPSGQDQGPSAATQGLSGLSASRTPFPALAESHSQDNGSYLTRSGNRNNAIANGNWPSRHDDAGFASPRDIVRLMAPAPHTLAGSPLTRAGLLQPRSLVSPPISHHSHSSSRTGSAIPQPSLPLAHPHEPTDIRTSTMQLSGLHLSPQPSTTTSTSEAFVFPRPPADTMSLPLSTSFSTTATSPSAWGGQEEDGGVSDLTASTSTMGPGTLTPHGSRSTLGEIPPSGLTLLLARQHTAIADAAREDEGTDDLRSGSATPHVLPAHVPSPVPATITVHTTPPTSADARPEQLVDTYNPPDPTAKHAIRTLSFASERTPLLVDVEAYNEAQLHPHPHANGYAHPPSARKPRGIRKVLRSATPANVAWAGKEVARALPPVLLGTLLNVLDGVSYGMIIFPAAGVFSGLGPLGVSMFFVSTIISQLIYSFGASGFAGANGSMMIEVVPFFHILATRIAAHIGEDNPREIVATTLVAFAFSSVLTGLTFFLLGAFRLGVLIGFFPRHILVGCIGGVGVFLIITGLTVSTRMAEDDFALSLDTLKFFFLNLHNLALWAPSFFLAGFLRVITTRFQHQLVLPLSARLDLDMLRKEGWIFNLAASKESWYQFYTYYDFSATRFGPLWATLPTQFALLFFNILHPPLNVPALAVSLNEDVDTNKELVAHGYSNLLAGFLGTVPNYLVYVNTLLFYRVGGTTRLSGFMLAGATALLLSIGTGPIAYIPVMVVSALIFVLGIDLVKEALWDTRNRVSRYEYATIVCIMVAMTLWDFVIGVLFGIVVSCLFFVVQKFAASEHSRNSYGRDSYVDRAQTKRASGVSSGGLEADDRSPPSRWGFLFFGTITHVEEAIRTLVEGPSWNRNPIQFLIVDFSLVAGVDMSSAEAFVRVQRVLAAKRIVFVFCGLAAEGSVYKALQNVGLFEMEGVELFSSLNDAMEWTENAYLRAWFLANTAETKPVSLPGRQDIMRLGICESMAASPRRSHLREAGWRTIAPTIAEADAGYARDDTTGPLHTLVQAFSSYGELDPEMFRPLTSYIERLSVPEGLVLWRQNDPPDGLYIIESGVLRASYQFTDHTLPTEESMVPGALAGELSALSGLSRNATVVVERPAVLWKLSDKNLRKMEAEQPQLALTFTRLVLKGGYFFLSSAMAVRRQILKLSRRSCKSGLRHSFICLGK
ncbi:hypothetical protein EW146_g2464 [Bondarzewia mesenterica]|uniref:STAS domain-containing protein n=1 Tax=Bondarzewia mesenterica TaxID=1095465 RepID=A0A4S4M2X9_9AGAM|nr:hypothetical protein EW146_g2464 [Bondarzewia mesenterica]